MSFRGKKVIVTAHHVISQAVTITATTPALQDGEARELRVLGANPYLDIAILEGPPDLMELPAYMPGRSSDLSPQMSVIAIGFALGTLRVHTTTGTISGRNDYPHNRIQTDATINPGNSGGPVLSAKGNVIVGIVTSGMNFLVQHTNFFTPIDEVLLSMNRMVLRSNDLKGIGIDMGYHLNCAVRSVDSAACNGLPGGALVVCSVPGTHLQKGDVIRQVEDPSGVLVDVNAFMRTHSDKVWRHDAIDFRSLLDSMTQTKLNFEWRSVVRRDGREMSIGINVGPNLLESRERFPDCETICYITFGGLVVQMLNENQIGDLPGMTKSCMADPETEVTSKPVITHTAAGCPFNIHGATALTGREVKQVIGKDGVERNVKNLKELSAVLVATRPLQIVLDSGDRIGTTEERMNTYENSQVDASLERGMHTIVKGKRLKTTAIPSALESLKSVAKEKSVTFAETLSEPMPVAVDSESDEEDSGSESGEESGSEDSGTVATEGEIDIISQE